MTFFRVLGAACTLLLVLVGLVSLDAAWESPRRERPAWLLTAVVIEALAIACFWATSRP